MPRRSSDWHASTAAWKNDCPWAIAEPGVKNNRRLAPSQELVHFGRQARLRRADPKAGKPVRATCPGQSGCVGSRTTREIAPTPTGGEKTPIAEDAFYRRAEALFLTQYVDRRAQQRVTDKAIRRPKLKSPQRSRHPTTGKHTAVLGCLIKNCETSSGASTMLASGASCFFLEDTTGQIERGARPAVVSPGAVSSLQSTRTRPRRYLTTPSRIASNGPRIGCQRSG